MPRVRLDIAHEDSSTERTGQARPDIRIDTDVFATLSGEQTGPAGSEPTIVRWLDSWRS